MATSIQKVKIADDSVTNDKLNITYTSNFYTANGTGTTFDVTSGSTANSVMVYYNGLMLAPAVDYDISGTTLTMTFTPTANSDILIRYMPV